MSFFSRKENDYDEDSTQNVDGYERKGNKYDGSDEYSNTKSSQDEYGGGYSSKNSKSEVDEPYKYDSGYGGSENPAGYQDDKSGSEGQYEGRRNEYGGDDEYGSNNKKYGNEDSSGFVRNSHVEDGGYGDDKRSEFKKGTESGYGGQGLGGTPVYTEESTEKPEDAYAQGEVKEHRGHQRTGMLGTVGAGYGAREAKADTEHDETKDTVEELEEGGKKKHWFS